MAQTMMITGASSGIGRAVAVEMARRGYDLALTARRQDALEALREEIRSVDPGRRVEVRTLDVTDYDAVPRVLGELAGALGGLDIVFANAGIALGGRIGGDAFGAHRKTVEVNTIGAMATIDAAVAHFRERGHGHVVATSSVAAFRGLPANSAYSASKAALTTYMEALRAEVYGEDIDVTVLHPGFIDTPLNDSLPNRPFLITLEKGARIICDLIERRVRSSTVPALPWAVVGRLLKVLPTRTLAGMAYRD